MEKTQRKTPSERAIDVTDREREFLLKANADLSKTNADLSKKNDELHEALQDARVELVRAQEQLKGLAEGKVQALESALGMNQFVNLSGSVALTVAGFVEGPSRWALFGAGTTSVVVAFVWPFVTSRPKLRQWLKALAVLFAVAVAFGLGLLFGLLGRGPVS